MSGKILKVEGVERQGIFVQWYDSEPKRADPSYYHQHEYMEMAYVVSGKGYNIMDGVKIPLNPGDYYFINPGSSHNDVLFDNGDEKGLIIVIDFYPDFLNPALKRCTNLSELLFNFDIYLSMDESNDFSDPVIDPLSTYFHDDDGYVKQLFLKNVHEYRSKKVGRFEVIRNNIINTLIILLQNRNMLCEHSSDDPFLRIYKYMCDNYREDIKLENLSKVVGYSPQYISANFAERTGGDNFTLALKKIRVKNACKLLVKTDKPITDILEYVGYKDYKSFYLTFKELTGMSPHQYRKNNSSHFEDPQI